MQTKDPQYQSASKLCDRYQVSRATFWRWSKAPGFPSAIRFGRAVRWNAEATDAFLSGERV